MNAIYIENGYAYIATQSEIIETMHLGEDRYVRIDDGNQYPQLCAGAQRLGNTLIYYTDEQFARDCNARLYKTRAGFDRAAKRIVEFDF